MMLFHSYGATWWRRTWGERLLLLEAWFALGWSRLLLLTLPFRWLVMLWPLHVQAMSTIDRAPMPPMAATLQAVSAAIAAASPNTPWHSNCLAQALAASILLRRRGLASTLYLGVAKAHAQGLLAHAWLVSDQQFVTGAVGRQNFVPIGVFACQARPHRVTTA